MWTAYLFCGVFLVVAVLGPLVIVLAVAGLVWVLWRNHARSEVIPFVILLEWLISRSGVRLLPSCIHVLLMHLVPCLPNVLSHPGFRKKLSLMSPPR